jgi:peptidoglycan/LPS O-acetylase OafA/YrhL
MIAIARNRSIFALSRRHENGFSCGADTQEDMKLTREQCNGMKGYAILLIMIHNFVDHLMGMGCNEMAYSPTATADFISMATSQLSIWHIFSFTGWIGVALFLFVSGYGLMRKYGSEAVNKSHFVRRHVIKLWILLIPVYLLYVLVQQYWCGEPHNWQSIIAQLTLMINLLSYGDNQFVIEPGVYWFFGAILQFYLVFLFIRKWRTNWLIAALVCLLALHYFFLYHTNDDTMWWFRQNCIGWGAPFMLGMLAARTRWQPTKWLLAIICLVSFVTLFFCLTTKALTPFTEVCTILFFGSLSLLLNIKAINAIGIISASIFVIHPFMRMVLYKALSNCDIGVAAMVAIYIISVLVLSLIHHLLYKRVFSSNPRPDTH